MTDDKILEVAKTTYEKCNYKEKCFGNLRWCDGTIMKICRAIQEEIKNN